MTEGITICIDGRDYMLVTRLGRTPDGEALAAARDEDGSAVTLVRGRHGGRWRVWTAPMRAAAAGNEATQ